VALSDTRVLCENLLGMKLLLVLNMAILLNNGFAGVMTERENLIKIIN